MKSVGRGKSANDDDVLYYCSIPGTILFPLCGPVCHACARFCYCCRMEGCKRHVGRRFLGLRLLSHNCCSANICCSANVQPWHCYTYDVDLLARLPPHEHRGRAACSVALLLTVRPHCYVSWCLCLMLIVVPYSWYEGDPAGNRRMACWFWWCKLTSSLGHMHGCFFQKCSVRLLQ